MHSATAVVEAEQKLQTPHGNKLVDLMLPEGEREATKAACTKSMELSDRNACDVELLCVGCAVPLLRRFPHWKSCLLLLRMCLSHKTGTVQPAVINWVRVSGAFRRWRAS